MDLALLADVSAWGLSQWAILIIVIAAIIGIVIIVVKQVGVSIPPFLIQILWIVLAVIIGVVAIRFLVQML